MLPVYRLLIWLILLTHPNMAHVQTDPILDVSPFNLLLLTNLLYITANACTGNLVVKVIVSITYIKVLTTIHCDDNWLIHTYCQLQKEYCTKRYILVFVSLVATDPAVSYLCMSELFNYTTCRFSRDCATALTTALQEFTLALAASITIGSSTSGPLPVDCLRPINAGIMPCEQSLSNSINIAITTFIY